MLAVWVLFVGLAALQNILAITIWTFNLIVIVHGQVHPWMTERAFIAVTSDFFGSNDYFLWCIYCHRILSLGSFIEEKDSLERLIDLYTMAGRRYKRQDSIKRHQRRIYL